MPQGMSNEPWHLLYDFFHSGIETELMAVREVLRMGHPVLRQVARPVDPDLIGSGYLNDLQQDMRETLHAVGGIGLAAPQIGVSLRLAIIEIDAAPGRYGQVDGLPFSVFINPVITVVRHETAGYWEGCLSVPGLRGYVERPQQIRVDYRDAAGVARQLDLSGFHATVMQHEFDHLDGTLYVDHVRNTQLLAFEQEYVDFIMPTES